MIEYRQWQSVDNLIREVKIKLRGQDKLSCLVEKCYANTLHTTIRALANGDTYIITGDIPAMWLRDSTAQMRPYLIPAREDKVLAELIAGLVRRQFFYINIDPYANAFNESPDGACWDPKDMGKNDWLWERKYEVDSLCYPIQLAYLLWKNTGCTSQFDENFQRGIKTILKVFRCEQNHEINSDYRFVRKHTFFTDTLSREGMGALVRGDIGLTWSGFRPSDDALRMLSETDAGTGLMHESVHVDHPERYTREWFSWANALFCEWILGICGYEIVK